MKNGVVFMIIKRWKSLIVALLFLTSSSVFAGSTLQMGIGAGHQAVKDLNTSSLVWKGTGPTGHIFYQTEMKTGWLYQIDLSMAAAHFNTTDLNYFSLTSSTVIGMITRFLKPVPVGPKLSFFIGPGFSSPVISIRHSNLWSMTTAIEGSIDMTANAGMQWKKNKWEATAMMDLPVASLAMVQDYNASGNHIMRFAFLHNSFQLFTRLSLLYRLGESMHLGLEARYTQRTFKLIKEVDSRVYGMNLVCRYEW